MIFNDYYDLEIAQDVISKLEDLSDGHTGIHLDELDASTILAMLSDLKYYNKISSIQDAYLLPCDYDIIRHFVGCDEAQKHCNVGRWDNN